MAPPLSSSHQEHLPKELLDLCNYADRLPLPERGQLALLCERVCHLVRLQNHLVRVAQDAVDQLQLDLKYLIFDLEVTRRERDAYLRELENL